MQNFYEFKKSIESIEKDLQIAKKMRLEKLNTIDFDVIERIFKKINVMESGTIIVGNSKVMAHLLPNLIPPIDRQYTMIYLKGNKNINNGKEKEWKLFKGLIINFFNPIAADKSFLKYSKELLKNKSKYEWDTSIPKIIDNIIVGAVKYNKK